MALVVCLAAGAGCTRGVIEGMVVDVQGQALPGVAVGVADGGKQVLTDGCGRYKLPYAPGGLQVVFFKAGYTPGRLDVEVAEARRVEATTVVLWRLPLSKGVYLFENHRYHQLGAAEPKRYRLGDHSLVYGAQKMPEVETLNTTPLVLAYKMPHYDVALCRMQQVEAALPESVDDSYTVAVWVRADPLPVVLDPIDEPDATLIELALSRPLEPGVYGVHWGALDGHTTTDPRVFLFRVTEPAGGGEGEGEGEEEAPRSATEATDVREFSS